LLCFVPFGCLMIIPWHCRCLCAFSCAASIIIVCDYSGQETVVAADLSGDAAMTKSVLEGADYIAY
jgi:hypothetical protein